MRDHKVINCRDKDQGLRTKFCSADSVLIHDIDGLLEEEKEVVGCFHKTSEKTIVMTNNRDQNLTGRGLKQQRDLSTYNRIRWFPT